MRSFYRLLRALQICPDSRLSLKFLKAVKENKLTDTRWQRFGTATVYELRISATVLILISGSAEFNN